jgi:hypothetical protein
LHDDLEYIAKRNLWLDLSLVVRAAMLILAGRVDVQQRHVQVPFGKIRTRPQPYKL